MIGQILAIDFDIFDGKNWSFPPVLLLDPERFPSILPIIQRRLNFHDSPSSLFMASVNTKCALKALVLSSCLLGYPSESRGRHAILLKAQ